MIDTSAAFEILYNHGVVERRRRSTKALGSYYFLLGFIGCMLAIAFYAHNMVFYIMAAVSILVTLFVYDSIYNQKPSILLEPRFLVCADKVIYYKLVDKLVISRDSVKLYSEDTLLINIEKHRFNSVSSKPEKSKINKQRKFDSFVSQIVPRIKEQNPDVGIIQS